MCRIVQWPGHTPSCRDLNRPIRQECAPAFGRCRFSCQLLKAFAVAITARRAPEPNLGPGSENARSRVCGPAKGILARGWLEHFFDKWFMVKKHPLRIRRDER